MGVTLFESSYQYYDEPSASQYIVSELHIPIGAPLGRSRTLEVAGIILSSGALALTMTSRMPTIMSSLRPLSARGRTHNVLTGHRKDAN
jgi:hypothetical protein